MPSRHRNVALSAETWKEMADSLPRKDGVRQMAPHPTSALYVSQQGQLLLHMKSHFAFLVHHASQSICHSGMVALPLACCLCQCVTAESARSSGQCSLGRHSARAAPAGGGRFLPPLTLCKACLLLNPGASPCAMLSGSKTLWAACHLIRLITIVVLDFT